MDDLHDVYGFYDVAISYRGRQDDAFVARLAASLAQRGYSVFFAPEAQAGIAGYDLRDTLEFVYRHVARHVVLVWSQDYLTSPYTRLEYDLTLERVALQKRQVGGAPARVQVITLDDARPSAFTGSHSHLDAHKFTVPELAAILADTFGPRTTPRRSAPWKNSRHYSADSRASSATRSRRPRRCSRATASARSPAAWTSPSAAGCP